MSLSPNMPRENTQVRGSSRKPFADPGVTRIAFYSSMAGVPWGGSEDLWAGAAENLARSGQTVYASCHGWNEPVGQHGQLLDAGVELHLRRHPGIIRRLAGASARWLGYGEAAPIDNWLRRVKPNVLVVSNGGTLPTTDVMNALRQARVPYLNLAQANREDYFVEDAQLDLVRSYVNGAAAMLFVSDANREMFERQIAMPLGSALVVRNPVRVPRDCDYSAAAPAAGEPLILACVGRLHPPSKGQDTLIRVLSTQPWRSRSVHVDLFGAGPHERVLRDLVAQAGLAEVVRFAGVTTRVADIWRTHHALVLPSRYEGLPIAVVEAMLCGRVVITTDAGGAKELVQDGLTGFIAAGTDADALDAAMLRAVERRGEWQAIGAAARARALAAIQHDPCSELAGLILKYAERVA